MSAMDDAVNQTQGNADMKSSTAQTLDQLSGIEQDVGPQMIHAAAEDAEKETKQLARLAAKLALAAAITAIIDVNK